MHHVKEKKHDEKTNIYITKDKKNNSSRPAGLGPT